MSAVEEFYSAASASVLARFFVVPKCVAEGSFGAVLAEDAVLLVGEQGFPFFFGARAGDFVGDGVREAFAGWDGTGIFWAGFGVEVFGGGGFHVFVHCYKSG